jgi:DNA-binding CsgD family transcriptional regulator
VLLDRSSEREALDQVAETVRAGQSQALVIRGEAGIGKTALLEYLLERSEGCRVIRVAGIQSEMELAFAVVHQLCVPMLDRLERLPEPQRVALTTAFGLQSGPASDRFLVGLAVLSLLSETAAEQPLVCVVDDAQWVDQASAQALAFAARRLHADSVALLFGLRSVRAERELAGLPELVVGGLDDSSGHALLRSVFPAMRDERVRDRIVAETGGNPLAILELPQGLTRAELASGLVLSAGQGLTSEIEDSFARRCSVLPPDTQRLLLIAAAEPLGQPEPVWRAAEQFRIGLEAAAPAAAAGLCEFGATIRFRHPLVRSAAYRSASLEDRRAVHSALAEVTEAEVDPDRRAWHLAGAVPGPDEEVAAELERSAGRAQARGGMAAAAAILQRAVDLTAEPVRRSERALAAAHANLQAGAPDAAADLLTVAMAGSLDELRQARAHLLRGQIAFASGASGDAPALLVKAAKQLETLDVGLARQTYMDAWLAALFAGRFAGAGDLHEASQAARSAPPPAGVPPPSDLLLDGLAVLVTGGRAQAAPLLRRAVRAFADEEIAMEELFRWSTPALVAAQVLWDDERWHTIVRREVKSCREAGLVAQLAISVNSMAVSETWRGDFAEAALLVAEAEALAEATGNRLAPFAAMLLAAFRGAEAEAAELLDAVSTAAPAAGQGLGVQVSQWVAAVLYNGLGRYELALAEAQQAAEQAPELQPSMWALPELIEAASRTGETQLARGALERLAEATGVGETDWARGIYARSRALLSDGLDAEGCHREAMDRLSRTGFRPELARAHLLYGEWLRRERRRGEAREQLRTAHEMFSGIGMQAFAARAARELRATGATARKRTVETTLDLTPQEVQIARLASDGLSNPEIGGLLFLSPRTVEYHLRKVFTKLGISSRGRLAHALGELGQ